MNRALFRLSLACLAMFLLLLLNVNYVQAFEANSLADRPGNVRVFDQQFQYQRGTIVAAGDSGRTGGQDVKIAVSQLVKGSDIYQRAYPFGPVYAPVTGYDSIFGKTGIEQTEEKYLAGTASNLAVHNLIGLLTGKPKQGATVYLTISAKAQQAAYQALLQQQQQGHDAGVVAIDPSTGRILALASEPTFDPNQYTTLDGAKLDKIDLQYRHDPTHPLLNRAINVTFPPGSSFKVVTGAAAFSTGKVANTQTLVNAPQPLTLPNGHTLSNDGGETCGDGNPPIIQAFWMSCNTAFGNIGIKLGGRTLTNFANSFGWNSPNLTIPLPVSESTVPVNTDPSFSALTAIGQLNDAATPLQEAMDAAAIANGGKLMKPYLVQSVQAPDLSTIFNASPTMLSQPVSSQVASEVGQMMIAVTQNPGGTAFATANQSVAGVEIAGKTGTAENGINNVGLNDAVFTCYAPANNPQIAVGVIVKGGGFGADAAAPIAVKIIQAYLGVH
jgi:peptidoglycan glycosyltransferase